jgi:hypothetical protein
MKLKKRKNKKGEINDGHYLELMDRLHVLMCTLNEHCVKHPVSKKNKDIKSKLEYTLGRLWDTYQEVGKESFKKEKNKNGIQKVISRRHKNSKD